MEMKNIEKFFLNSLLRISIAGVLLILITDILFFPEDTLSITIDSVILFACGLVYPIRHKHPTVTVLILTSVVLVAMVYQCLVVPVNTTTSLSIILVIGFIFSVMLKRWVMWIMHGITFITVIAIFVLQFLNPDLRFSEKVNDVVTVAITYSILYFILTYATGLLKLSYDNIHQYLKNTNLELREKANEFAVQNTELLQTQENLSALNKDLEKIVNERTARIQIQNEILIKYSYTTAHHLRGPVARLLGLASIYKLEPRPSSEFVIEKMVDQANEIDTVIKQINIELELNHVELN